MKKTPSEGSDGKSQEEGPEQVGAFQVNRMLKLSAEP
jgi:hypothetical protein